MTGWFALTFKIVQGLGFFPQLRLAAERTDEVESCYLFYLEVRKAQGKLLKGGS